MDEYKVQRILMRDYCQYGEAMEEGKAKNKWEKLMFC